MKFNVHDTYDYRKVGQIEALDDHSALQKAKKKFKQKAPLIESVANAAARDKANQQPSFVQYK